MLGAIAGDMIGSPHEFSPIKTKEFSLFDSRQHFTDDSVLTVAVAQWLLDGLDLVSLFHDFYSKHPFAGFGGRFKRWAERRATASYGSFGNGSAMRVSPVGWAFNTLGEVLAVAGDSAAVTHDDPRGIAGARATAGAIYIARTGGTVDDVREFVNRQFPSYNLHRSVEEIRRWYRFDPTCQGSVPEAIVCVLEAEGYEDAVRNAVSLGGDADTQACIAGGIAEALWGLPDEIETETLRRLDRDLIEVTHRFREAHCLPCST